MVYPLISRTDSLLILQVRILCPDESDNDKLNGQVLEVEVATLGSTIGELKTRLADELALQPNKQQFSRSAVLDLLRSLLLCL